jgi:RNA polymerase sigma factor (TIGR02999 family)
MPNQNDKTEAPGGGGATEVAPDALFVEVYDRLKAMASRQLARDHVATLNTTGLVHELYERMANQDWGSVGGPANFFAYAATAMRNIVIDRARHRLAQKSGGAWLRVTLSDHGHESEADDLAMDVLVLNDALERLAKEDARAARVVELRYFAGLQVEQIADLMGLNRRTITRDWDFAKAFLRSVIDK